MSQFSTFRDARNERDLFRRRIFFVAIIVSIFSLILLVRLAYLELYQHRLYTTLARQNQLNLLPLEPNRGLVYDRNGVLLAENIPVFDVVITPNQVANLSTTIDNLRPVIHLSDDDIEEFYKQLHMHRRFQPIPIKTKLTENEVAQFSVEQYRFPGVAMRAVMIRYYPFGSAFAQVLGYVGRINAQELSKIDQTNYSATNFIGKTGVEQHYETLLHGVVGNQQVEMNVKGEVLRTLKSTPAVTGDNLYLTIDSRLQMAAQQALGDQRGAVVILNPQNGEVLALVSTPSFDPNLFAAGISQKDFQALQKSAGQPLYDRVLHGQFPPGSTIKPYMALEGLASGVVTLNSSIVDPGWYQLQNSTHIYHDWQRKGHGLVNITKAIEQSCDTYFYGLAFKMGIDRMDTILQKFGFGAPTGIDLDNESSGIVPSPAWKFKKYDKSWYPGDTLITGIGQGYLLATPLQLVSAVSAIAMHGEHYEPHVLLKTQTGNGEITETKSVALSEVKLPDSVWKIVLNGMQGVISAPGATAYHYFQGVSYTLAGKTGTAQVFSLKKNQMDKVGLLPTKLRDNSLFEAFSPVKDPQLAIVVVVQNSSIPAEVYARKILDFYWQGKSSSA